MARIIVFLVLIAGATAGLGWLADKPGTLTVDWLGYQSRLSVFQAVVLLLIFLAAAWIVISLLRNLIASPSSVSRFVNKRKQQQGLEALTSGMIAVGAGDRQLAARYASQATRALPNEPLTNLLRAQTAQLAGDRKTAQRVYEQMLISPQTELLGLRGLFLDAERSNDLIAARSLAEQALKRSPKLGWASQALFDIQCKQSDWSGAIDTLATARRNEHVPRKTADRRRAVLLTAQAMAMEDSQSAKAEAMAVEAHDLAPDLVPAAEIAGRLLAARGKMQKAATVVEQTWRRAPHPDLALIYAHARPGDSLRDRLQRVCKLAAMTPGNREGVIAVANAAIEARAWNEARATLEPLLADGLSARVCVLMARAEGGEKGDQGRVREWLARAIHAPRDPVWVAEGHVSDRWAPISPVNGKLDAYEWKVAEDRTETVNGALLLEELAQYALPERDREPPTGSKRHAVEIIESDPVKLREDPAKSTSVGRTDGNALTARRGLRAVDSAKDWSTSEIPNEHPTLAANVIKRTAVAQAAETRTASDGTFEFYVAPHAPDDPGTDTPESARKAAS